LEANIDGEMILAKRQLAGVHFLRVGE